MDTQTNPRNNTQNRLANKRILVTRARHQAPELSQHIREAGGVPVEFPVIRIGDPDSWKPVDTAISNLSSYGWLVFTSQNGVNRFFDRARTVAPNLSKSSVPLIAAIGPSTAETVSDCGYQVTLQPEEFRAEELANKLTEHLDTPQSILLARSNIARPVLKNRLEDQGFTVDEVHPYHLKLDDRHEDPFLEELRRKGADLLTFASSQTVRNFSKLVKQYELEELMDKPAVCIGPITAETARDYQLNVVGVPKNYTIDALFDEILNYVKN